MGARHKRLGEALVAPLLEWYRGARRPLPWRRTRDPYRIWLSETMLQQTRVDAVVPYYERFLARFPTLESLAVADEQAVLREWAGLGYYARARNLHRAAGVVLRDHGGELPRDAGSLAALPGVGRYTAGALRSIAFDERAAVVDGNVRRVLARLAGARAPSDTELWRMADALVPEKAPGDWNQALMELGATVCTPRRPSCPVCPVGAFCAAHAQGDPERFPASARRPAARRVRALAGLLVRRGRVLLVRRPSRGLLGGLWELPTVEEEGAPALLSALLERTGIRAAVGESLGRLRHQFTHRDLSLEVMALEYRAGRLSRAGRAGVRFCTAPDLERLPLSTLTRKALALRSPMVEKDE
ncbi:MAG: A/G-specific adenine glycosylase [Myxococcota bacterium]